MTLKEAKKILKKEGFILSLASKVINQTGAIREFEKPEVCEAIKVANANKWTIGLSPIEWDEREARLKKEYEKNTKASDSDEEQPNEGNPALKEAASQFNDALLDEQAKKIEKLTKENEDWKSCHEMQNRAIAINNIVFRDEKNRLGKEIARLNKIIHKKNMKIEELRKESSSHLRGKIKVFYENVDLEGKLKDKDAVLSDVAEELRLSKIREKNLTEVCQKYMKENEKLKKELEEKTKLVEIVRNGSKQYCYYGIAAEKMIRKMAKVIVKEGSVSSEDYKEYRRLANGYRFNPQLPELSEEEEKKLSPFRDDSVGAVTNQKDCSPVKDNHPTEDNPEEVEVDEILERVRKALEEGHTVSIDYEM